MRDTKKISPAPLPMQYERLCNANANTNPLRGFNAMLSRPLAEPRGLARPAAEPAGLVRASAPRFLFSVFPRLQSGSFLRVAAARPFFRVCSPLVRLFRLGVALLLGFGASFSSPRAARRCPRGARVASPRALAFASVGGVPPPARSLSVAPPPSCFGCSPGVLRKAPVPPDARRAGAQRFLVQAGAPQLLAASSAAPPSRLFCRGVVVRAPRARAFAHARAGRVIPSAPLFLHRRVPQACARVRS